jgi:hypothetical protein
VIVTLRGDVKAVVCQKVHDGMLFSGCLYLTVNARGQRAISRGGHRDTNGERFYKIHPTMVVI